MRVPPRGPRSRLAAVPARRRRTRLCGVAVAVVLVVGAHGAASDDAETQQLCPLHDQPPADGIHCGPLLAPATGVFGRDCQLVAALAAARHATALLHKGACGDLIVAGITLRRRGDPMTGPVTGRLLRLLMHVMDARVVVHAEELACLFRVAAAGVPPPVGRSRPAQPDLMEPTEGNLAALEHIIANASRELAVRRGAEQPATGNVIVPPAAVDH
jgi:hypothetical protein